jgi:hypothetical protein
MNQNANQQPADGDLDGGLIPVNSRAEIPRFASDEDAAAFWETHCLGPGLLETARRPGGVWAAVAARNAKRKTDHVAD